MELKSPDKKTSFVKSIIPFLFYFLTFALFLIPGFSPIVKYSVIFIASSLIFILLCRLILNTEFPEANVKYFLAAAIIIRLAFLFIQPIGSDDYYRYLWDGKVIANGINPYQYAPLDNELEELHSETLPSLINFPELKTVYPPLAESLFYLSYLIGGEDHLGLKLFLFLFELMTLTGIHLILKRKGFPKKNILLYALIPLPLFQIFIDAHVDGFGLTLLIFSIYFYFSEKKFLSFFLIGLSACIKPLTLILVPIIFLNEKEISQKVKVLLIPAATIILLYLPFISVNVFESLTTYSINWKFNGIIFESLNLILKDNQASRLICGILFAAGFLIIIFSKKEFITKTYLSVFILLIFSPVVHTWYVLWLAVLLPFVPRWSGILFACLVSLAVLTTLNYSFTGEWKNYPLVMLAEYMPVVVLFIYEIMKKNSAAKLF